ncbi:MAG: phosphoadenylyl-sulfate reductase [Gemmatimonadetes bacterium]|nr:phosphoadenylyl-sulfate reductase [Gemmatimonadota bacterium]
MAADPVVGPAPLTPEEAAELNQQFETAHPREVLRWATAAFPDGRVAISSTFGPSGMVLIHMMAEEDIRVPVLFVDTLYHFPETLAHAEHVRSHYGLDLRVFKPAASREAFEAQHGPRLWERDEELFHQLTKVEPMKEALTGFEGWVNGRRRDQSLTRAGIPIVEQSGRTKVNPLARWTLDQVWEFVMVNRVLYHPLHDEGYASIGDEPLTTPTLPGEHERAGRWRGSTRTECGLHQL